MNKTSTVNIKMLRGAIKARGNQSALARELGVHRSQVRRWLIGKSGISKATYNMLQGIVQGDAKRNTNVISEPGDYGIVKIDGSYKLGRLEDFHGRLKIDTAGVTLVFLEEKEESK